ncbi:uncharacterized protein DNG_10251 [Cephalotrichum gorgonifer]|uniref:Major facilitator superfamily (MFS) profile domain-containing protein n=1 Tax=Cephalotrichum gorgonifer TaxID=2041049 RepID=A0AAE8N7A3_9PEZI|nr:uncharacterized protein DNG_10251 [Cephalotrichum gorgonifer]
MDNSWSWRIPSLLQCAPSVYQLLLIYLVPESPRWLVNRGRLDDARRILNRYHAGEDTATDVSPFVRYEMVEIEAAIDAEKMQNTGSYLDFLATILRSIGIEDPEEQNLVNGGLTIFYYGISITDATGILRFGRRRILLVGFASMAAAYLIWTVLSSINQERGFQDGSLGIGVVAMIFVFQLFYNLSIGPVLPTYMLEVMPFTLRAKGYTIEQIFTYGAGLLNGFVNPIAMEALGWKHYIVWVVMLCVWLGFIWLLFPETTGWTLEEVSQVFDGVDVNGAAAARVNEKGEATEDRAESV